MRNVIILGSGRSGTSLLGGLLSHTGYYMGEKMLKPDQANPRGYFECLRINYLNEEILNPYLPARYPGWLGNILTPSRTSFGQRWLARIPSHVEILANDDQKKRIDGFVSHSPFCFKDPRFCYTLPAWLRQIKEKYQPMIICAFRHPGEVFQSTIKEAHRDSQIRGLKLSFDEKDAQALWKCMYQHVLHSYAHSADQSRWIFLHFEQVLQQESVLDQLSDKLQVSLYRNFIEPALNRFKKSPMVISDPELLEIYQMLCNLAEFTPVSGQT